MMLNHNFYIFNKDFFISVGINAEIGSFDEMISMFFSLHKFLTAKVKKIKFKILKN